ncbi:hypothetical protein UY3_02879 [Chelonia mydas]|uniref:Uncharacterized protein n=1 Tax=Chelonia mydas TaxID=8469 RepID=M7CG98_CHEMY|nr:hypothetical protein UY3_02879 [Chelonia mydas]
MESALTPTPVHRSEFAPGTTASVCGDRLASLTSWHRSPSTGHKKAKKTPSSEWHRGNPGAETRPMLGSPRSPPASRPLTHVERSSLAASETLEALQAARDVKSMPVPGVPPMSAPGSRCKPLLGSPQSLPARHRSQSREHSRCRSPPSDSSGHSPRGFPSTPTRLSGWVSSDPTLSALLRITE